MALNDEEVCYLIDNYQIKSASCIAKELNKTLNEVGSKIQNLTKKGVITKCSRNEKTIHRLEVKYSIPVTDLLSKMHWDEEKSIQAMSKEFGISRRCISNLMDSRGIPRRNISESVCLRYKYATKEYKQKVVEKAHEAIRNRGYSPRPYMRGDKNHQWKGGMGTYTCCHCGIKFKRPPSHVHNPDFLVCSEKCRIEEMSLRMRGENNPAWRGGKRSWRGIDWKESVEYVKERDHYVCQHCGMTEEECKITYGGGLQVHHIVPYRITKNNDPSNLTTLCNKCHMLYERNSDQI